MRPLVVSAATLPHPLPARRALGIAAARLFIFHCPDRGLEGSDQ